MKESTKKNLIKAADICIITGSVLCIIGRSVEVANMIKSFVDKHKKDVPVK